MKAKGNALVIAFKENKALKGRPRIGKQDQPNPQLECCPKVLKSIGWRRELAPGGRSFGASNSSRTNYQGVALRF